MRWRLVSGFAHVFVFAYPFAAVSCSEGAAPPFIAPKWEYSAATSDSVSPPGLGPERRVLVALRQGSGEIVTLDEVTGIKIEGPYAPMDLTAHAPVVVSGTTIVLVSTIGKITALNLSGRTIYSAPTSGPLGRTGPLSVAPDGSLRVATTDGRLLGIRGSDGTLLFSAAIDGAAESPLAVAADGTTFVATDVGRLIGIDAAGNKILDASIDAPASGPSILVSGAIAVGELNAVRVIDRSGKDIFRHPRAARVVGTLGLPSGEILAWGEDGVLDLLSGEGEVRFSLSIGPPLYANPIALPNGKFAVFDSAGTAHLVSLRGSVEASLSLAREPAREIVIGEVGFVYAAVGNTVRAFDFMAE